MTRRLVGFWVVVSALMLEACGENCATIANTSVGVRVEASDGEQLLDLEVVYSVDGGAFQACQANPVEATSEAIPTFNCGEEEPGEIVIEATSTGYALATEAVTVEADRCNVISEDLTLVLEPAR